MPRGPVQTESPAATLGCEPCRIAEALRRSGGLIQLTPRWTLNAAVDWTTRPWLVLQTAQHRAMLSSLDEVEAAELGPLGRAVTAAVRETVAADRVYLYLLNEVEPPHVHFHVLARLPGDPVTVRGPALLGTPAPPGAGWGPEIAVQVGDLARQAMDHQPQASSG
jgi:diadenosine tetraphosphate (Ap4A) HIT family hydrolase